MPLLHLYRLFARRVCNQQNGKSEYQIKIGGGWHRRPDGLRRFFDAHTVIPSKQFL
jgi:hypothetical protein